MKVCLGSRRRTALCVMLAIACATWAVGCAGSIRDESTLDGAFEASAHDSERIVELEARIAELERDLARVSPTPTESVRVSAETTAGDEGSLVATANSFSPDPNDSESPSASNRGPRTVLRLDESHASSLAIPTVSERLPVVAIPAVNPPMAEPAPLPTAVTPHIAALPIVGAVPNTATAPTTPAASAAPLPVASATPAPVEDLTDYRAGLANLTSRHYESAIASLSAFLRDHPGSAQSDDALYWRATAQYALRHYREALIDYDRVVRVAPRGERAADSLYHSGLCQRHLGNAAAATSAFTRLRRDYPGSVAARLSLREDTT